MGIQPPASIDPGSVSDAAGALVASLVCEPPVQIDPLTGERAHGIIESVVAVGEGAGFTMRVRDGVKFHNGQTLSAQDVVYSLSRVARHDYAAPLARLVEPVLGYAAIHAPPPPTETGDPTKRALSGLRAISRTALEIGLTERNAEFARVLALPLAAPVPRGLPDRDPSFARQPVCAGPYKMTDPYKPGDKLIKLRRFEDYYAKDDAFVNGGAGYPETIEFRIMPDREAEMRSFQSRLLDIAHVPPERLAEARALGDSFMTTPLPSIDFVGIPAGLDPLDDPTARILLSRAIDRERLIADVYAGGRIPAGRFLPPAFGSLPETEECLANVPRAPINNAVDLDDPVIASLRGKAVRFKVNDDFQNRALAEAIGAQWRERLGLEVEVVVMGWDAYLNEATGPRGLEAVFRESWTPAYPSMDAVMFPLFDSGQIGNANWARFNSRDFDRLLERKARREEEDVLRRLKYLALERMLCTKLPLIPLTFGQEEYLVRVERIGAASGVFFDLAAGQPLLRELYVRATSE